MGTQVFLQKERKERKGWKGVRGGAAFLPYRLGPGAERNRCVILEPRMDKDGYAVFFTEGKEGKEGGTRRGGIPAAQVESRRAAQQVRDFGTTDEHGWVSRFFLQKERKGRKGVRGGAAFLPHRLSPGAQRNRSVIFEPRMNTDGYAGFFTEGKEGKEGGARRGGIPAAQVKSRRGAQQVRADFFNR